MKKGMFVNGHFKMTNKSYDLFNPHNGEKIAEVANVSIMELKEVIDFAEKGFESIKKLSAYERSIILYKTTERLISKKDEIAKLISLECAKPITAAKGEVERAIQAMRFSAEEAKRLAGESIPLDAAIGGEGKYAYTVREPIGIVGAITPFNFPLNLVVHKVGPAIAAGNSIIIKPAEQTPLTSLLLAEILTECGLPSGTVNVVPGDGPTLGKVLLEDERIKKISFTGSPEVGKLLKSQAGLKRMTLELGSNAALYIDRNVNDKLDQIVTQVINGSFTYSGQACISIQRLYIHEDIYKEITDMLVTKIEPITVGDPTLDETIVSSLINFKSQQRILKWINEAKEAGAKVLIGGEAMGNGILPTVITNVDPSMKVSCGEVFGPVLLLQPVKDHEEALQLMNNSIYGLNAGVYSNDLKSSFFMAKNLEVGQVFINDTPALRFDHMPYGGVKNSGYGKEGIKYAIQEMTELKMISINYS